MYLYLCVENNYKSREMLMMCLSYLLDDATLQKNVSRNIVLYYPWKFGLDLT